MVCLCFSNHGHTLKAKQGLKKQNHSLVFFKSFFLLICIHMYVLLVCILAEATRRCQLLKLNLEMVLITMWANTLNY